MDVRYVDQGGIHAHAVPEVDALLTRTDGFVWVDVPSWDDESELLLIDTLKCHTQLVETCRTRNHVPAVHAYSEHIFVAMHAPLRGRTGHVHLLEIDQVIGRRYLVTVHGPLNPEVDPSQALVETNAVLARISAGRFRPSSPAEVSYALGSAIARRHRALIGLVAEQLPELEQEVMASQFREPEALLEALFLIRHELTTGRTMAAQSHDIYARVGALDRFVPDPDRAFARDLADQFDRVRSIADGEAMFLHGVIELYQTRVNTKMTVAMERLAVIAAVTLPITAIASIYGMNTIVNDRTHYVQLGVVLLVMLAMSFQLLRWARHQGWW
jgi:magnesium transporter